MLATVFIGASPARFHSSVPARATTVPAGQLSPSAHFNASLRVFAR